MNCVFCKIADGEVPNKKVYEDDKILVFHDLDPQASVRILIIPKRYISSTWKITKENSGIVAYVFEKAPQLAKQLGLGGGFRLVNNYGNDGSQTVQHLYSHLLGGRFMAQPPG